LLEERTRSLQEFDTIVDDEAAQVHGLRISARGVPGIAASWNLAAKGGMTDAPHR
jgi:hypothetical protein